MNGGRKSTLSGALAGVVLAFVWAQPGEAALLESSTWTGQGAAGHPLPGINDNDRDTGHLLAATQMTIRCVLDLGSVATVHRLYFAPAIPVLELNPAVSNVIAPRTAQVRVMASDRPDAAMQAWATRDLGGITGREIRVSANLRFPATAGRYVIIELAVGDLRLGWNLGEVELYGWPGDARSPARDAVALPAGAAAPLKLAADELSYYASELAGYPIPVVAPDQTAAYTGTIYRIADLKPLAQTYEQMTNNLASGILPSVPVNVERDGREVVFRAWPYRNALWSVWEFLDRQGVRWLFPDAHGDHVPAGSGIDPDVAPFQYEPSTDFIYANFGVEYLRDDPDAFLHFWRNRWSHTWGHHQRDALGGDEVPKKHYPNAAIHPDHVEGLAGYPHNFNSVLPPRILEQHLDWCGILTNSRWAGWVGEANMNRRALPRDNQSTFDLTHPGPRQFIINKAIAYWPEHAKYNGNLLWMLPEDSTLFSEDEPSVALRQPLAEDYEPYAMPYPWSVSGDYYDFIRAIAEGIREEIPEATVGAMAYSNTHLPPEAAPPLPDNVLVDVCMYGSRNLPLSSPKNAEMRRRLTAWREIAAQLRHYDYDLIHSESGPLRMPIPLVSAMADRARFYASLDMLAGGSQADLDSLPYNPWNYYAYPRFHWNVEADEETVMRDFFAGYFREASEPMLAYYRTIERYLIANNVSLQARGYDYGLRVGAYPIAVLCKMHQHLERAEAAAAYWVTVERVRRMREGLDWILDRRGLTYEDLAAGDAPHRAGPGQSALIDLRFASIQTAGQDVGDAWFMFSWAEVGEYVKVEQAGRYRVTIRAGIGYTDPEPGNRQMVVHIGGMDYGPFLIDHISVDAYTLLVEIPAGILEFAVEDRYNRGPFKAQSIAIERDDGAAPAPARRTLASGTTRIYDYVAAGNSAALVDSDWDRTPDIQETMAGTDEFDPDSFFAAHEMRVTPDGLALAWSSVAGRRYSIYHAKAPGARLELVEGDLEGTPPENTRLLGHPDGNGIYMVGVN